MRVLPARLPEHLVAGEEAEVHARGARRLDVGALWTGPVLVVADGEEDLVLEQLGAAPIGVDAGRVADVVAVALEPAHHRVLGVEDPVLGPGAADGERPVVADLVGAARVGAGSTDVQAVAAVLVVRLPGRIRGLEEDLRSAGVVADHEHDVARLVHVSGVLAHQLGHVDPGHGVAGHAPRRRHAPVAAVDQAGRRVVQAGRLRLRERLRRRDGRDLARAEPRVPAQAVEVDPEGARAVDLELDGVARGGADVGREALDARVARLARPGDVPLRRRVPGQRVLEHDLVLRACLRRVQQERQTQKREDAGSLRSACQPHRSVPGPSAAFQARFGAHSTRSRCATREKFVGARGIVRLAAGVERVENGTRAISARGLRTVRIFHKSGHHLPTHSPRTLGRAARKRPFDRSRRYRTSAVQRVGHERPFRAHRE